MVVTPIKLLVESSLYFTNAKNSKLDWEDVVFICIDLVTRLGDGDYRTNQKQPTAWTNGPNKKCSRRWWWPCWAVVVSLAR